MIHSIEEMTPMAVMIDRSRTGAEGLGLFKLWPVRVWQLTENYRRLSWQRLQKYDLLLICGNAPGRYSPNELLAIKRFVRSGGTLILAANAGAFELATGLPVSKMTADSIADLFGYTFLSASKLPMDIDACRGYRRQDLVMTAAGRRLGLDLGDMPLRQSSPITTPAEATVLLRRKSGPAIAATSNFGRGRVLVFGDLEVYGERLDTWSTLVWTAAMAPALRRGGRKSVSKQAKMPLKREPYWIGHSLERIKSGAVSVYFDPAYKTRAREVLKLAAQIWFEANSLYKIEKEVPEWHIKLLRGCRFVVSWRHSGENLGCFVGGDVRDDFLAWRLAFFVGRTAVLSRFGYRVDPFWLSLRFYFVHTILKKLGHTELAEKLKEASTGGPDVDLGRVYSEVEESKPMRRLCFEIEAEFGSGFYKKAIAAVPKKKPYKNINQGLYNSFDLLAFILGRAVGPRIYPWLKKRGHTVRRIPLEKAGSDELKGAINRTMKRIVLNPNEPTGDRYDALRALAEALGEEKVSFDKCARISQSVNSGTALPGAARLALAHDERAVAALKGYLSNRDKGLVAIVALLLTTELQYGPAMNKLYQTAGRFDNRFKLAAGYALIQAGDKRGREFSFARLRGCKLKEVNDGMRKLFPVVDGYEVANIWATPYMFPMPYATAFSAWYVEWVHTSPRWRRRGLAAMALPKCIDHRWANECATTSLHTGTRNVAHSLYRQNGLVDFWVARRYVKSLRPERPHRPPQGVRITSARTEDTDKVLRLWFEILQDKTYCDDSPELVHWPTDQPAFLAWEGKKLLGAVSGSYGKTDGSLAFILIEKPPEPKSSTSKSKSKTKKKTDPKRREKIGLALLHRVHQAMLKRKMKTVAFSMGPPIFGNYEQAMMGQAGYADSVLGFVELHRINRLDQYLREIKPALEGRLKDATGWADWSGTIVFAGKRLRAKVVVSRGEVKIQPLSPGELWPGRGKGQKGGKQLSRRLSGGKAAIVISGCDEAIERIMFGKTSPFEEQMQITVEAIPTGNALTTKLLEVLFPRIVQV